MIQVFFCPESPPWLMKKGRYLQALISLSRLRKTKLIAARDLHCMHLFLLATKMR